MKMWVRIDDENYTKRDFVSVGQAMCLKIMSAGEYAGSLNSPAPLLLGGETLFFVSLGAESSDIRLLATIPGGDSQSSQVVALQDEVERLLARGSGVLDVRRVLSKDHESDRLAQGR